MYKCKVCGELFFSRVDCDSHLEDQHSDADAGACSPVQYRCQDCGRMFGHHLDVRNHALREHGSQRPNMVEVEGPLEGGD